MFTSRSLFIQVIRNYSFSSNLVSTRYLRTGIFVFLVVTRNMMSSLNHYIAMRIRYTINWSTSNKEDK